MTAPPAATTPAARRLWPWALAATCATLLLLATAVLAGNFALGPWAMLVFIAVPLSAGLPTTLAALACLWLEIQPLPVLIVACLALGFAAQLAVMHATRWLRQRALRSAP